jgi:hypothetical protein
MYGFSVICTRHQAKLELKLVLWPEGGAGGILSRVLTHRKLLRQRQEPPPQQLHPRHAGDPDDAEARGSEGLCMQAVRSVPAYAACGNGALDTIFGVNMMHESNVGCFR